MMYRNQKLLETVREFECVLCGSEDGTVVAAHSNQLRDGKGKGIKAHDYRIAALCYRCHMAIDQGHRMNKQEKEAMWEEAHRKTIGFLFERGKLWVQ
jgi:hypothetical protein